jgi:DNA-binding FrmR family transcriptional regulator
LLKDEIVAKGESADYVSKNQVSAVSFVEAGEADRPHELDLISKREGRTPRLRLTWRTSAEEVEYGTGYGIIRLNMSHTVEQKQELLLRAKRIQGQVQALVRALEEERDCDEVLQVMSAARGAMNSLMAELLEGHIRSHVLNGKQKPTSKQIAAADEVISMVKSYLK